MARRRRNGTGSVFRRKSDGLWIAQVSHGTPPNRRYIVRSGRTRDEAEAALARVMVQLGHGITPSRETTSAYLDGWLRDVRNIRPNTLVGYRAVVTYHLNPTIGHVPLTDLTPVHVERMIATLSERLSPKSVRNSHGVLRRALGHAVRIGKLSRNVASREFVDAPRFETDEPDALTEDQLDAILAAAKGDRLEALFVVAADTGLRRGELLGLAWENIDYPSSTAPPVMSGEQPNRSGWGWLRVEKELTAAPPYRRVDPKTRLSKRSVPLTERAVEALTAHRTRLIADGFVPTATGPVFVTAEGEPLNGPTVTHRFYDLCDKAGLDRRPFKILRATYASRLFSAGVAERTVSQLLGHARTHTTLRHYIATRTDQAAEAVRRLA